MITQYSGVGLAVGIRSSLDPIGYAATAAAHNAVIGYGSVSTRWSCDEASGDLTAVFGAPSLTAGLTPVYGIAGPRGDKAVGFDGADDSFAGGTADFNVSGTDDLLVEWTGKYTAAVTVGTQVMLVKGNSGAARWTIYVNSSNNLILELVSASGVKLSFLNLNSVTGQWHTVIAAVSRASNACKIALRTLGGAVLLGDTTTLFAGETLSNADAFTVGNRAAVVGATSWQIADLCIGAGSGVATGVIPNIESALNNYANAIAR